MFPRQRHKFKAVQVERDGIKFQSKKEARYYDELKLRQRAGDVVMFLRQVPFDLPGGVKYRLDFLVFRSDGTVDCVDVKGFRTEQYKTKKKMVEAMYPIKIIEK